MTSCPTSYKFQHFDRSSGFESSPRDLKHCTTGRQISNKNKIPLPPGPAPPSPTKKMFELASRALVSAIFWAPGRGFEPTRSQVKRLEFCIFWENHKFYNFSFLGGGGL